MLVPAVLLVDDDLSALELVAFHLRGAGYRILQASDAAEAMGASAAFKGSIPLLLTDIAMPGVNGMELAKRICHHRPETKVIYITAYRDDFDVAGCNVLEKPFTSEQLLAKIQEILPSPSGRARVA